MNPPRFVFGSLALFLSAAAFACSSSGDHGHAATGPDQDWVVQTTFDKAYDIVKGVDYLPFEYKTDGCYARALYMTMELAAQGMESNEVFAFAREGTVLRVGDIRWSYHVAPMLEVGSSPASLVHMIIDPSLAHAPLTENDWLSKMMVTSNYYSDAGVSDMPPITLITPGSDYAPREGVADTEHQNQDTPDFSHLPAFKESDITSACNVMWNYIAQEPGATEESTTAKQAKLLARTPDLVASIRNRGKLVEDVPFSLEDCQRALTF